MPILRLLPYSFLLLFFAACQKAINIEDAELTDAIFTLQSVTPKGNWQEGKELTAENYLEVKLAVTGAGSFHVASPASNGFSFSAEGEWTTGEVTLNIPAVGKPEKAGPTSVTLTLNDTIINVVINVQTASGDPEPTAEFVGPSQGMLFSQSKSLLFGTRTFLMMYESDSGRLGQIIVGFPHIHITYNEKGNFDQLRFTYGDENGSNVFYKMVYDDNDRVIEVRTIGSDGQFGIVDAAYTYYPDGKLRTKYKYPGNTKEYLYTDGNLTHIVDVSDTTVITYDNRANRFSEIYPQYYFLDQMNTYDERDLAEMFYFSKNYPTSTSFNNYNIMVQTNGNGLPGGIYLDGELAFSYGFKP